MLQFDFTLADVLLVVGVSAISVAMAYAQAPRAKSILHMIPVPFSLGLVSTGRGVDVTHVAGVLALWAFFWLAWWLHARNGWHILAADAAAVFVYSMLGIVSARFLPHDDPGGLWFFSAVGLMAVTSAVALLAPQRMEPGNKSKLPIYVKVPLVMLAVTAVVTAKNALRGFMPTFPLLGIFAVYEGRRSLHTLAVRIPILNLCFIGMLLTVRFLLPAGGVEPTAWQYAVALAPGWLAYAAMFMVADRFYTWRNAGNASVRQEVDRA